MYIESAQNPRVKAWTQLKQKKGRQTSGLFLVEGERLVTEVLQSSLTVEAVLWNVGTDELDDALQQQIREVRVSVTELSPSAFAAVSDTVTPQGVIAIVRIPSISYQTKPTTPQHALVLDGIQDPGNVGTLIRSADAFGVQLVCCGSNTVDPFSPKAVRASMGGLFRVPVLAQPSLAFIERWRAAVPDGQVVTTSATATTPCYDVDFQRPTLLLIGSEATGVSEESSQQADVQVSIPMQANLESLNAAMAGSILLYESYRQRLAGVVS